MTDHGKMNWCCGGGGGVSSNERAEDLKHTAFNRKKSQIEELEVDAVVTACSNCRMVMEEGLEVNEMDIPLLGLTEMIADHLAEK
jgi:Fe-S oxidoreductase